MFQKIHQRGVLWCPLPFDAAFVVLLCMSKRCIFKVFSSFTGKDYFFSSTWQEMCFNILLDGCSERNRETRKIVPRFVKTFYPRTNGDKLLLCLISNYYFQETKYIFRRQSLHTIPWANGHYLTHCQRSGTNVVGKHCDCILFDFNALRSRSAVLTMCLYFLRPYRVRMSLENCFTYDDKSIDASLKLFEIN